MEKEEPIPKVKVTPGPRFVAEFKTSTLDSHKANGKRPTALERCMRLFILLVDAQTDSLLIKRCGGERFGFLKTPMTQISSEKGEIRLKPNVEYALETLGLSLDVFAEEDPKVYLYADLAKKNFFVVVNPYDGNWLTKLDNRERKYDRIRIEKILEHNTLDNQFDTIDKILEHLDLLKEQSQDVLRETSIGVKFSNPNSRTTVSNPWKSNARPTAPVSRPTAPVSRPTVPVSRSTAPVSRPTAPVAVSRSTVPVSRPTAPVAVSQPTAPVPQTIVKGSKEYEALLKQNNIAVNPPAIRPTVALTAEQKRQVAAVEKDVKKAVAHIIVSVFQHK